MSEGKDKKKEEIDASSTEKNNKDNKEEVVVKEQKTRKIQINVSRQKEIDELQKEIAEQKVAMEAKETKWEEEKQKLEDEKTATNEVLAEKKAILEKQALEQFEADKKEIMELAKDGSLTDEQMAEIEERLASPKNLEIVKGLITMLVPKVVAKVEGETKDGKKPPQGKAPFTPPKDAKEFANPEELIGSLYNKAYYDPKATIQQKKEAVEKIDKLFTSLIEGKAWAQLKSGLGRYPEAKISECPRCGEIILGEPDKCPKCKVDLQQKMRKRGEVD